MKTSVVTVTGGTGYIASWIVRDLLKQGHTVRITVRDISNIEKYKHLREIEEKTKGKLEVFEADLLKPNSFNAAVDGAEIVMHTASPFVLDDSNNAQKALIEPAVNGTKNLLDAVNKTNSVKRVILTSSLAAIYGDNKDMGDQGLDELDESIWNASSSLTHNAYSFSKTQAEKAAWEIASSQNRWDLVTIHPGFVLGPSLTKRKDSTSINTLLRILRGDIKTGAPDLEFMYSDVRDISKAHILAAFTPEAKGRYIVANENGNLLTIGKIIDKEHKNKYKVPRNIVPKWLIWLLAPTLGFTRKYVKNNIGYPLRASNLRSINDLNMEYRSLNDTVLDHVEQLVTDNLI